jgi:hypothetical protein
VLFVYLSRLAFMNLTNIHTGYRTANALEHTLSRLRPEFWQYVLQPAHEHGANAKLQPAHKAPRRRCIHDTRRHASTHK